MVMLDQPDLDAVIFERGIAKMYRLTILTEGGSEAEADAYADEQMATWGALPPCPPPYRWADWRAV